MNRPLMEAWGAWLQGSIRFPRCTGPPTWRWFWSLTFRDDVTEASAQRALKRWLLFMAHDHALGHVRFVVCTERQEDGRIHFHLVHDLPLSQIFNIAVMTAHWRGNAHGVPYDPSRHAAYYIAKEGDVDANVACPRFDRSCRRGRGPGGGSCMYAPGPW